MTFANKNNPLTLSPESHEPGYIANTSGPAAAIQQFTKKYLSQEDDDRLDNDLLEKDSPVSVEEADRSH